MYKYLIAVFPVVLALLTGCAQFPTQYDRVDAGTVRCLDFIYDPPEAAPGDTVLCRAVFAGDEIAAENIDWFTSYRLVVNKYGVTTALDTVPLQPQYIDTSFSDGTSCVAFRFVIPASIMHKSPLIADDWLAAVPENYRSQIPPQLALAGKEGLIGVVDSLSRAAANGTLDISQIDSAVLPLLPSMIQLCTVQMRLYGRPAGGYTIESNYTVRYNNRFAGCTGCGIYRNTNPVIDSVGVYLVKARGLQTFNPATDTHEKTFVRLFGQDDPDAAGALDSAPVITIDAGMSCFIAAFSSNLDSALSIDAAAQGSSALRERHIAQWYFQHEETDIEDVSAYDFMNIASLGGTVAHFFPPLDKRVESATIWCEVWDQMLNEVFRPQGSTLKELRVRFAYTKEYLDEADERK